MAVVLSLVQWWGLEVVVLKRRLLVLGLSGIGSGARASHLLHWAIFYRFDFRFWFGRLCFALCLIYRLFILLFSFVG